MNTAYEKRIAAVEDYLNNKASLRKTAKKYGISYLTLWRWSKWYKEGGRTSLDRERVFAPWNKLKPDAERCIAMMKEHNPSMTIFEAQKRLSGQGLRISANGIWSIWKRYGLTDITRRLDEQIPALLFPESTQVISPNVREAQKLVAMFGTMPFHEYYRKAHRLRMKLEHDKLLYSAVRLGVTETVALSWMGQPDVQLSLIRHLKMMAPEHGYQYLRYLLTIGEGITYAQMLDVAEALDCARLCRSILKQLHNVPHLWRELANLNEHVGECRKALRIINDVLAHRYGPIDKTLQEVLYADLSLLHATAGKYQECMRTLAHIDTEKLEFRALAMMLRAQCSLIQATVHDAQLLARNALDQARKDEIPGLLHAASLVFAGAHAAVGELGTGKHIIARMNPLFRKAKMNRYLFVREMLSCRHYKQLDMNKYPGTVFRNSVCRLAFLTAKAQASLKLTDYRNAYYHADRHGLMGLFHRFLLFFPESVITVIDEGKSTGLPKLFVQLPVFNKTAPVYRLNFLGPPEVYHYGKFRLSLPPKDVAFIIFCALCRKPRIPLDEIYETFWPGNEHAPRILSHLLVRVRKNLKLTTSFLNIERHYLSCRCEFVTDYDEYADYIAQAMALERIDNWTMAEKDYCRAFLLFRDKPFSSMYDRFSEEKRIQTLFKFEQDARHFIQELKRNTQQQTINAKKLPIIVQKTIARILTISPHMKDCLSERNGV